MQKKVTYSILLLFGYLSYAQFECPTINTPLDGEIDVPVDIVISWDPVPDVPSYLISLGTTPDGTDIVDNQNVGGATFTPELGLPENTDIYVTITLFFFNQENIVCPSEMFRTEEVTTPPPCTAIASPSDGDTEVTIFPTIAWNHAPTATGYEISLGTAPGTWDILDDFVIENALAFEPSTPLPYETEIFVRIIPFNENGPSETSCQEFSFTTEAEVMLPACAKLISPADGEVNVALTPLLEWNDVLGADGYRISIGTNATENNILDNGAYTTNATEVIDFFTQPNVLCDHRAF